MMLLGKTLSWFLPKCVKNTHDCIARLSRNTAANAIKIREHCEKHRDGVQIRKSLILIIACYNKNVCAYVGIMTNMWEQPWESMCRNNDEYTWMQLGLINNQWLRGTQTIVVHDDVIKRKYFPRYWPFVRGIHRSPVNSPRKGQWRGALMFFFHLRLNKSWVNNREAGDLRRIAPIITSL